MIGQRIPITLVVKGNKLDLVFKSKAHGNDFARMSFYSLLLHSFKPDENGVWRSGNRLDVEIRGWTKKILWERVSETNFKGLVKSKGFDLEEYRKEIQMAMDGIIVGEKATNGRKLYLFQIGKEGNWLTYKFYSKARTIAALCVLYDLKPHSRNHLEINIPVNLVPDINWPRQNEKSDRVHRFYGDPSKIADVLRNEGWSREGEDPVMIVSRKLVHGQQQQMYQLKMQEQSLEQQVMRTNISAKWRNELFKLHNYTCRICHLKYPKEYLAPDHRIPVIFEADELNNNNFKKKLMTLCRYCNQQKREFCKRIDADYDWEKSPWAFPEKFELNKIRGEIERYAKTRKISVKKVLELLRTDES